MNEHEICDLIKARSQHIKAPRSLEPDQIEERLKSIEHGKRSFFRYRYMVAVACMALVVLGAVVVGKYFVSGNDSADVTEVTAETDDAHITYSDAYDSISSYYDAHQKETAGELNGAVEDDSVFTSNASASTSDSASAEISYTDTDVQVDGISEGDIVKTDGKYIYSVCEEITGYDVAIFSVEGMAVERISNITIEDSQYKAMYLEEDSLILISTPYDVGASDDTMTEIYVYDVSDPASPESVYAQTQSGSYATSRVTDGYLYTLSKYMVYSDMDKEDTKTYVPQINGEDISEDAMCSMDKDGHNTYLVMTSLATDGSGAYTDKLCTLGGGDVYYVSDEYIYVMATSTDSITSIQKYRYAEGTFSYKQSRKLQHVEISDSYSLHEQDGDLYMIYHDSSTDDNGLCVLNEDLEKIGQIRNLGEDESIYASYYIDDMAYFVTYRDTDPVFAVDISDPTHPTLTSELELPGFSDYLHSFADDQLIGIGLDEDDMVKMSVFTTDDDKEITQTAKKVLTGYVSSMASYDRHGVLVYEEWPLLGFTADCESGRTDYLLYSYDGDTGKFKCMLKKKNVSDNTRGLIIGSYLYLIVDDEGVSVYPFPTCGTPGTFEEGAMVSRWDE